MENLPKQIGPYEATREIGRGGMGVVYLARDSKLDRAFVVDVATKESHWLADGIEGPAQIMVVRDGSELIIHRVQSNQDIWMLELRER